MASRHEAPNRGGTMLSVIIIGFCLLGPAFAGSLAWQKNRNIFGWTASTWGAMLALFFWSQQRPSQVSDPMYPLVVFVCIVAVLLLPRRATVQRAAVWQLLTTVLAYFASVAVFLLWLLRADHYL